MKMPFGIDEADFISAVNHVVTHLIPKFRFGYLDRDDMKQQAFVFALEAMTKYDPSRPLENFLYTHIRNQFINLKRNKYARHEPPCKTCPFFQVGCRASDCMEFEDRSECTKYTRWKRRNDKKKSLMEPSVNDGSEVIQTDDVSGQLERNEIELLIDQHLPVPLRGDYLRMLSDVPIAKHRKDKVRAAVLDILKEHYGE